MDEFITVSEASEKLGVSKKTIYSYINWNEKKIWLKKVNGVSYINEEKLNLFLSERENKGSIDGLYNDLKGNFGELEDKYNKLQKDYNLVVQEKENLQNYNNNLQNQINNTTLSLKEEKNNNSELLRKNEELNNKVVSLTDDLTKEKINWIKKFYLMLSLFICSILVILFLVFNMFNSFKSFL